MVDRRGSNIARAAEAAGTIARRGGAAGAAPRGATVRTGDRSRKSRAKRRGQEPSPEAAVRSSSSELAISDPLDFRWPGGKGLAGLHQWIVGNLPPHVWYAEPFCGKGGVFRNKPPALRSWLIDADPAVVAWWGAQRLPGAIVQHGDGIRWCELAAEWGPADLLVYLDPPYMLETRTRKLYRHELSAPDHARLLAAATAIRGPVVVSGYWSPLYAERLDGWRCEKRWVITRGGTLREECLWLSPGVELLASSKLTVGYSELGHNFRERERVARKLKRWGEKLRRLPRAERRALLLAMLEEER